MGTSDHRRDTWAPRSMMQVVRASEPLTAHEARIIAEAVAAGRVTIVPPAPAMGLTPMEARFGPPWIVHDNDAAARAARSNLHAKYAMQRRARTGAEEVGGGQ